MGKTITVKERIRLDNSANFFSHFLNMPTRCFIKNVIFESFVTLDADTEGVFWVFMNGTAEMVIGNMIPNQPRVFFADYYRFELSTNGAVMQTGRHVGRVYEEVYFEKNKAFYGIINSSGSELKANLKIQYERL